MDKEKREPEKPKNRAKTGYGKHLIPGVLRKTAVQKPLILAGFSLIVSLLLAPSFVVETPFYQLGDIATQNIKAKREFLIEDREATSKKREEAVRQAAVVYDLDGTVSQRIQNRLEAAFEAVRGDLPGLDDAVKNEEWLQAEPSHAGSEWLSGFDATAPEGKFFQKKKEFEALLGFQVPEQVFFVLFQKRFSNHIQERIVQLLKLTLEQGVVSNKTGLLQAQRENLVIRKTGATGAQEEHRSTPPHPFQDLEEVRKLIKIQALENEGDPGEIIAIVFLASQSLQPNLLFNLEESQRRREEAYASVKPVYLQIMKNEMLVREGQRVGPEELAKLRGQEQGKSYGHRFLVYITLFLFSGLCIWMFVYVAAQHFPSQRMDSKDFLFLGIVLIFMLAMGNFTMWVGDSMGDASASMSSRTLIYAIPISAGAMIACIFFGATLSLIFSLLLSLFAGLLFGKDLGLFLYFLIGSFVAVHGVCPCRNRIVPIKAGLLVGCSNVVLIVLGALLQDQWAFLRVVTNVFFGFFGGILAGIVCTGFAPLAEMVFGYMTDIKLLELVTMDQPLLQELMVQAPGTYHHSIIVGNMVEAAAKSIGANSLLAKVAAYYHDIGKIRKSVYFIENQFDSENRHEKLAPSMSSLILISHVKEGVELARHHRLGKSIIDIISQHHGTSLISFFYNKAQEARQKAQIARGAELPPIDIDDYRYPGSRPQTKEAGLVMLADVVEAACRSLTDPTPARIQGMVNRLINSVFSDGQLGQCELTLKDLHHIAKHFNQILATVHHRRIEYPAISTNGRGRADASDSAQREPRPDRDKPAANQESGRGDLKRLGIH
jgi:putative nucleotidyltransferase with HDIG domain